MLRQLVRVVRAPRYTLGLLWVAIGHPRFVLDGLRNGWRPALLRYCASLAPALEGAFTRYEAGFFGQVFLFDEYEVSRLRLPGSPVVIDVGANVGFFSWKVHSLRPSARIFACEPQSDNLRRLRAVYQVLHIDGAVCPEACGKAEGEATLYLRSSVTHSLDPAWHSDLGPGTTETVPVTTLDKLCSSRGIQGVDLLKIDTEGAEIDVLSGAVDTLRRTRYVVLEYHSTELREQCRRLLTDAGFHCRCKTFWGLGEGGEGLLLCARR